MSVNAHNTFIRCFAAALPSANFAIPCGLAHKLHTNSTDARWMYVLLFSIKSSIFENERRIIMSLAESEVEARFVRARRASKVGSRFWVFSSWSGLRRVVKGRITEFVDKPEEPKMCMGLTEIRIRARAWAAVRAATEESLLLFVDVDIDMSVSCRARRSFTAPCWAIFPRCDLSFESETRIWRMRFRVVGEALRLHFTSIGIISELRTFVHRVVT